MLLQYKEIIPITVLCSEFALFVLISFAAYLNDVVVGAICRREQTSSQKVPGSSGGQQLYIMTLGVFPAYQRLGIGTQLVNHVLEEAEKMAGVDSVSLHVWVLSAFSTQERQHTFTNSCVMKQVKNEAAAVFYRRLGFEEVCTDPQYYKSIQPTAAYVFKKSIVRTSALQTSVSSS